MDDRCDALFVSPHLDDAVFACGTRIAASRKPAVVTIFAGRPPPDAPLTAWDTECGFAAGDDVVEYRRREDRDALDVLGARPIWLDFRDDQYGEPRSTQAIACALAGVLAHEQASAIYFPLGLFHTDHRRASDAALALVDRFATLDWYAYEDAIYRRIAGAADARLCMLRKAGFALDRHTSHVDPDISARKRHACSRYRSQLRALGTRQSRDDMYAPEAYWAIARQGDAA